MHPSYDRVTLWQLLAPGFEADSLGDIMSDDFDGGGEPDISHDPLVGGDDPLGDPHAEKRRRPSGGCLFLFLILLPALGLMFVR